MTTILRGSPEILISLINILANKDVELDAYGSLNTIVRFDPDLFNKKIYKRHLNTLTITFNISPVMNDDSILFLNQEYIFLGYLDDSYDTM